MISNIVSMVGPWAAGQAAQARQRESLNKTQNSFGVNANIFNPTGRLSGVNQAYRNIGRTDDAIRGGLSGPQGGYSGPSGNDGTGNTAAAQRDTTYDLWGGLAGFNSQVSNFDQQKGTLLDDINNRVNQEGQSYGYGVEDLYNTSKSAQDNINRKSAQNELAKMQGRNDILGKVSRGTRSGNVMLGQKNAGNSSAAAAIANAYGDIGNRDMMKVEQGFAVNNEGIALDQQNFELGRNTNARRLEDSKNNIINNIVNEASTQLQALDAQIAGASLPNRIAIEQEKNNIRSNASSKLSAFDVQLNQARSISGYDQNQRLNEAQRLSGLGVAAEQPFQASPEQSFQQQTQTSPDGFPIYSLPKRRI